MRIEAFILVQDLDKLVQERVREASMPHNRKCRAISFDASNSFVSEAILEYIFLKKFVILIMVAISVRVTQSSTSVTTRTRW